MSDVLRFPESNPIRIVILEWKNRQADDIEFNLWHKMSMPNIDRYCQPWVKSEPLQFQFHTSFDDNFVELVRAIDNVVVASDYISTGMLFEDGDTMLFEDGDAMLFEGDDDALSQNVYDAGSYMTRECTIDFETLGVTVGKYYIQVKGTDGDGEEYYARSEVFDVQLEQRNTVKLAYYNNEPAFDLDYRSSSFNPTFRVRADFIKPYQDNDVQNFISAESSITKVVDVIQRGRLLETLEDMPAWMYEKLNLILAHDILTINGKACKGGDKYGFDYQGAGVAWITAPELVPVLFASSNANNRYDSGSRVAYG